MATQSSFITKVITAGSLVLAAALIAPASMNFNGFAANAFAAEEGGGHEGGSHESGGTKGHKGKGDSDKGHKGKGGSDKGKKTDVYGSDNKQKGKDSATTKPWAKDGLPKATLNVNPLDYTKYIEVPVYAMTGGTVTTIPLVDKDGNVLKDAAGNTVYFVDGGTATTTPVLGADGNQLQTITVPLELGRLNVSRAPADKVFTRQLTEVLGSVTNWNLYTSTESIQDVINQIAGGDAIRVDSPLQNVALYSELMKNGTSGQLSILSNESVSKLAAIFIAGASDKGVAITAETVEAMNKILGVTLPSGITNTSLAADANAIREQILKTHDGIVGTVTYPAAP